MIKYFGGDTNNDKWAIDIFNGKKQGFFVEAGALNGINGSSTYALERYFGWTGILVEPKTEESCLLTAVTQATVGSKNASSLRRKKSWKDVASQRMNGRRMDILRNRSKQ
jgi:hypothetical protein